MCFSPEASFTTAAVTGVIGVLALSRARSLREAPLAATPLLFAAQQSLEGLLWLAAPQAQGGPVSGGLVLAYLIFAKAFWPLFAPAAVMLVEPDAGRRRAMTPWLATGAGVSAYLAWGLASQPYSAQVIEGHMVYRAAQGNPVLVALGYLTATTVPLLLSSHRTIRALGVAVSVGCVAAYGFYWAAFLSVWCFFAAAASAVILVHFEQRRRAAPRLAAP